MENKHKFCPHCGEQQEKKAKFCTDCGYNFETKEVAVETAVTEKKASASKFNFNKKGIIAFAIILVIGLIGYFTFGGVAIAGTYTNGSETVEIARNGKMTTKAVEEYNSSSFQLSVYLDYDDISEGYRVDPTKDFEIEASIPTETLYWDESLGREISYVIELLGIDKKETGGMTVLSGKMTPFEANMLDIDLSDIFIEADDDGIFIDDEFFEKF